MRYILNNEGYIANVSFGADISCNLGNCTEYTGNVPEGYETLDAWHDGELERLNAWKIVEGNLVFDEARNYKLEQIRKKEEEENRCISRKYVDEQFKSINTIYEDELSNKIEGSSLFTIDNTKATEIVEMLITPNKVIKDDIKIKVTNENILGNKAIGKEENGLTFVVNENKSITINGEATENTEFIINGSLTNTDILFFLKGKQDYSQYGLSKNVNMNLYSFDGTDRNLVNSQGNGTINLDTTSYITCVTLTIAKGKKFENVTIYPMIRVGAYVEGTEYIECEENELLTIDLEDYTFIADDTILVDRTNYLFTKNIYLYPSNDLFPSDGLFPGDYDVEINGYVNTLKSFKGKTIVQCDKDVSFNVKYYSDDYLNERFAAIEVREEEIVAEVSRKYTTKEETEEAKQEAIDSANNSTIEKLKDYSTTVEMNSAITQKANEITSTVSETYITKTASANNISTAKTEAINSANTSTDNKLKNYSTTVEMNSAITQKANEINLELEGKVDEEKFTGANIMLAINDDNSSATINADKISLSGKEINLTSENVSINSDNFSVDSEGNMSCNNADITGGKIELYSEEGDIQPSIKIINPLQPTTYAEFKSGTLRGYGNGTLHTQFYYNIGSLGLQSSNGSRSIHAPSISYYNNQDDETTVSINGDDGRIIANNICKGDYTYEVFACKTLYVNSVGTAGLVTLSETAANFDYLEIFFVNNDGFHTSMKVESPDGKNIALTSITCEADEGPLYIKNSCFAISGTTITPMSGTDFGRETQVTIAGNQADGTHVTKGIFAYNKITKVIGYK